MRQSRFLTMLKRLVFLAPAILSGCVSVPPGIEPVANFDVTRYLGTWYEIARLDHSFERGLTDVSATYTRRKDGGINVLNKGYNERTGRWKQAKGRAYFVDEPTVGYLKVSFFGPFYGSYVVIALDRENYSYALVCGPNRSYLWVLARDKTLSPLILDALVAQAKDLGFDTNKLIFVAHNYVDIRQ